MKKLSTIVFLLLSWKCILADPCVKISPPECKTQDNTLISYHPHQDCSLFYRCDNGKLNIFSCPLEERYSAELNICLPENQVACSKCEDEESSMLNQIEHTFNKLLGIKKEKLYDVALPIISDTDAVECEDIPTCGIFDWGVTKPYPPDCSMYISCDSAGNISIEPCPEGEHYSPTESKCMDPALALCPQCEVVSTTVQP